MSLRNESFPALPEDTARVARAAFKRKGNIYLTIGDQLGAVFESLDFGQMYAADGKPALSPNLLALVTVFQFMENLPDRDAADAVRSRIDWKYALHLSLADTGFDDSVLSEFRERLAHHEMAQQMFEQVLIRLRELGLVRQGGKQRTDATHVLAATQLLNRVQLVAETMRTALEALADYRPAWLQAIALPHWYERYSQVLTTFRLPRTRDKQDALALSIAADGFYLLKALAAPEAPGQAGHLPEVQVLAQVWQQQFQSHDDGPHWRPPEAKPPASQIINTPYDPEVRYSAHHSVSWTGYQTHWTETCDADLPHVITHVTAQPATVPHCAVIPEIHAALAQRDLLPQEHLVDAGYVTGPNLSESAVRYGVELVGPIAPDSNWQARLPDGITLDQFNLDWAERQATCPQGQTSCCWSSGGSDRNGLPVIEIAFPREVCLLCGSRERCSRSTTSGRTLKLGPYHEAIQAARRRQTSETFVVQYAPRAGIEGTVSAAVRSHGARRTRYIGADKANLQAVLTALAINLKRTALWLMGERPGTTRPRRLACLAPTHLAV
jgi:transposase